MSYNDIKYQCSVKGTQRWSRAFDIDGAMDWVKDRAKVVGKPYRVKQRGDDWGPKKTLPRAISSLKRKTVNGSVGDVFLLSAADGERVFQVKVVEVALKLVDTVGNERIDLIFTAITTRFAGVVSWGICNCRTIAGTSKWSQHAYCNAWDLHASDAVMAQIFDWAIMEAKSGKLPIAHIIYNKKIWTPAEGLHGYGGTNPHTDHIHIDAAPNFTGRPACA